MPLLKRSYTWDRVRYALARFAEHVTGFTADGVTPQVTWADNDQGPMVKPYVSIQRFGSNNLGFPSESVRTVATTQRLSITQTATGEYVVLNLIWAEVRTTVVGGDSLTDTRDKFITAAELVAAQTREPLIFAADGAADILITAKTFAIPDVEAVQGCALVVDGSGAAEVEADAKVTSVSKRYRVRYQLHFETKTLALSGDDAADEYASTLRTELESSSGLNYLRQWGVGVTGIPSTDQNATVGSGALQELRIFFEFDAVCRQTTYVFAGVESIDQVDPPVIQVIL